MVESMAQLELELELETEGPEAITRIKTFSTFIPNPSAASHGYRLVNDELGLMA